MNQYVEGRNQLGSEVRSRLEKMTSSLQTPVRAEQRLLDFMC